MTFCERLTRNAFRKKNLAKSKAFQSITSPETQDKDDGMKREIGVVSLCLMGIGASIGSGVFALTGEYASIAGPAVVLSFVLAAIPCMMDALCYAELASSYPVAGSVYLYTYMGMGQLPAVLVGVNLLFDYHIGAAAISRSMASYLVQLMQLISPDTHFPRWLTGYPLAAEGGIFSVSVIAPVVLFLMTALLCAGSKEGAWTNFALTSLKIIIILLVVGFGIPEMQINNLTPFAPEGAQAVTSVAGMAFFAYVGFDSIANSAEEAKNPGRNLPIAIVVSLLFCALLYGLVCFTLLGIQPYDLINVDDALSSAFEYVGITWIAWVIDVGAVVGLCTTLLVGMYAQSRVYLSIARDGLVPGFLGTIHPRFRTPVNAQLMCGVIASTMAALLDVKQLSKMLSIGVMMSYTSVCICVLIRRSGRTGFTSRWAVAAAVLWVLPSISIRLKMPLYVTLPLAVPPLVCSGMLFTKINDYTVPQIAPFLTPGMPYLPVVAIALNVYFMCNLEWEAWARLGVVTVIVVLAYVLSNCGKPDTSLYSETQSLLAASPSASPPHSRDNSL